MVKDKDFDGAAWATKHDTSFKDLIANARKSIKPVPKPADQSTEKSDGVVVDTALQHAPDGQNVPEAQSITGRSHSNGYANIKEQALDTSKGAPPADG
jgi:E3 ubiquitin-protein ligase RAD18